jgi:hypothetical protein
MASSRREGYSAAAAARARLAYEADQKASWQYPSLYLHIHATARGVRISASVSSLDPRGRMRRTEIASGVWRPKQVTERLVVEWGERALRRWLEANQPEQEGAQVQE